MTLIAELAAQQRIVAEQVLTPDPTVDLLFREVLGGRQFRPQRPQTEALVARLRWPTHEALLPVEVAGDALDLREVDGLSGCGGRNVQPDLLGSQTLDIAMAGRSGEHIQQLDVPRDTIVVLELISQRTRHCGDVIGEKRNGNA